MKVKIRNLGVIEEANIDLKPFTILIGPNNAGKTWLAYFLSGIFGVYGFNQFLTAYEEGEVPKVYPSLDRAVEHFINNGSATIDLVQFAEDYGEIYFNSVAQVVQQHLPEFMSTQEGTFKEVEISIDLTETKIGLVERILHQSLKIELPSVEKPLVIIRKDRGDRKLFVLTADYSYSEDAPTEEQIASQLPRNLIGEILIHTVFSAVHQSLYPRVYTLPTERTTFITLPFGKKKVSRGGITIKQTSEQEQEARSMIGPVNYFLSMMHEIIENASLRKGQREKAARNNTKIRKYIQLAQLLEKQILNGEVTLSQTDFVLPQEPQLEFEREIMFQPSKDRKLEVAIASSMVKELSPLVLFLRYLAVPRELLIIDEPEMNLHPEAQAKLVEFLAMLVNAGLNILITTHSPYVLDHLTNLFKAAEAEDKESTCSNFFLKRTDAFIKKDKVSVYMIDQRHAENAVDQEGVVQWNTFGQVSERISEIYFTL